MKLLTHTLQKTGEFALLDTLSRGSRLAMIIMVLVALGTSAFANESTIQDTEMSLITILPGTALYSSFGHSCIRIVDKRTGRDILYNYGLSANPFDAKFALGMLRGRMEFLVAAGRTAEALRFYREVENRTIIEQILRLDDRQRRAFEAALAFDALPENRVYNYRYFSDNCTTRIALMLDDISGGGGSPKAAEEPKTLRVSIGEVLEGRLWMSLAIDTLFGPLTDKPGSGTERIFLPEQLMRHAAATDIKTADGTIGLVGATRTLYQARVAEPAAIRMPPMVASVLLASIALALAVLYRVRILSTLFDAVFFSLTGLAGLAIVLFWVFAGYQETAWNINLLWASPLPIIGLGLATFKRLGPVSGLIFKVASLAATIVVLAGGMGIQTLPTELRIVAATMAIRCAARGGFIPRRLVFGARRQRSSVPSV